MCSVRDHPLPNLRTLPPKDKSPFLPGALDHWEVGGFEVLDVPGCSGASVRRVTWMLAWDSGTVPSFTCTSAGLPSVRMRWTALPRAGITVRWVTEFPSERTVMGTSAAA